MVISSLLESFELSVWNLFLLFSSRVLVAIPSFVSVRTKYLNAAECDCFKKKHKQESVHKKKGRRKVSTLKKVD